jgi:hypothetical protein
MATLPTLPMILLTMSVICAGLSAIYLIQAKNYLNKTQDIYDEFARKQKEIRDELNKLKDRKGLK